MAHFGWARGRLGPSSPAPRWPGTCSSAARRSPAATSPTRASRTCPISHAVGFPIAEIDADGCVARSARPTGTGGLVDARTVKEQLLYEVHDPAAYLTPDVVADISEAEVRRARPATASRSAGSAATRGRRRSRSTPASKAAGSARARSPTPGRTPRRARGWRPTSCASASARALDDPLRPDRRAERLRRRRRPRCSAEPPAGRRARRPPARGRASSPTARASSACSREVTALYTCGPAGGGGVRTALTPAAELDACRASCRASRVPARFEIRGAVMASDAPASRSTASPTAAPATRATAQHQRDRLSTRSLPAARRAGHRGAGRRRCSAHRSPVRGQALPAARSCTR